MTTDRVDQTSRQPRAPRIDRFLRLTLDRGASDFFFCVGRPPMMRLDGEIDPIRYRTLNRQDFELYLGEITPPDLWEKFTSSHDVDFSYEIEGAARFRVNLFQHNLGSGATFRIIPTRQYTFEELGLPPGVERFTELRWGLVLVTGPTGSGKSTTLSALVHRINETQERHIITIDDPLEFSHDNIRSLVTQREVGKSAKSFARSLEAAMREDPDVVMLSEMRDPETIRLALTAAEMGVLVLSTLPTNSAARTIARIVNLFTPEEQESIRSLLAGVLRGIMAQQLLRRREGGRVAAFEVLFGSSALGNVIREGKMNQIENVIQLGHQEGMISMDESLLALVRDKLVDPEVAYERAIDKKRFAATLFEVSGIRVAGEELDEEEVLRQLERQAMLSAK